MQEACDIIDENSMDNNVLHSHVIMIKEHRSRESRSVSNSDEDLAFRLFRVGVRIGFSAFINPMVVCTRSENSLLSVSTHRKHTVFQTAGFKDRRKPCPKTHETVALRIATLKVTLTLLGSSPGHW